MVLASELLREAEKLVSMRLHPQTIISGYRWATDIARKALTNSAQDNSANPDKFREDLLKVSSTQGYNKVQILENVSIVLMVVNRI